MANGVHGTQENTYCSFTDTPDGGEVAHMTFSVMFHHLCRDREVIVSVFVPNRLYYNATSLSSLVFRDSTGVDVVVESCTAV